MINQINFKKFKDDKSLEIFDLDFFESSDDEDNDSGNITKQKILYKN